MKEKHTDNVYISQRRDTHGHDGENRTKHGTGQTHSHSDICG